MSKSGMFTARSAKLKYLILQKQYSILILKLKCARLIISMSLETGIVVVVCQTFVIQDS